MALREMGMGTAARRHLRRVACALLVAPIQALPVTLLQPAALAQEASPFDKLVGRCLGEGRFGTRDGKTENVKCRVTYLVSEGGRQARQTIRCATEGTSIEVQSMVTHEAGTLKGTWKELSRTMSGDLTGSVTANGFKVAIRGSDLNANMEIIVKDNKQVIEIQFIDSAIIGLTLILTKG